MPAAHLSLRIDLANGARVGPGKVALLEAIASEHSISAAARRLGMSYRRAWLLIDDLNRAFHEPVVETCPGRSHGAGATLTGLGARIVALYRDTERRAADAAAEALQTLGAAARHPDAEAPPGRARR